MKTETCPQCSRQILIGIDLETWAKVPLDFEARVYYVAANKDDEYLVKRHDASFVAHDETCGDPSGFCRKEVRQVGLGTYSSD